MSGAVVAIDRRILATLSAVELTDVWRNIATASPSIDPFDDVVGAHDRRQIARAWEAETNGLSSADGKKNRESAFAYGDKRETAYVFGLRGGGRFSAGTFGVWYGAEEEDTSIWESLHYLYRDAKEDFANASTGTIRRHRRMFKADLKAERALDLRPLTTLCSAIIDPLDYSFSRQFGDFAVAHSISLIRVPSARFSSGTCVAVFDKECLVRDKALFEYYVSFDGRTDEVLIERLGKRIFWTFPKAAWDLPMAQ